MTKLKKIAGINLILLLIYFIFIKTEIKGGDAFAFPISFAFAIAAHVIFMTIISVIHFSTNKTETGKAYALSAGLVAIIGFSACVGGAAI